MGWFGRVFVEVGSTACEEGSIFLILIPDVWNEDMSPLEVRKTGDPYGYDYIGGPL